MVEFLKFLKNKFKGFTIIELMVVFFIISLISSFLILYNKTSSSQIILSLETVKLVEALNKTKALSLSTYIQSGAGCGYGINIDYNNNSYSLFKYGSPTLPNNCQSIASSSINQQDPTYVEIEKNFLSQEVKFEKKTDYLDAIFFVPPDPIILIWKNGGSLPTQEAQGDQSLIYLSTKNNSLEKIIKLNIAGQISY
jgi:prepilin-type N-terminal cleavage/methylation domain-containing protein